MNAVGRGARVGLVLGGGGVVGQAYHSGVLAVLQHDFGFDARSADLIVGTSAGSITGTLLRLGVSPEDLAAWTVKAPLSSEDAVLHQVAAADLPELAPFRPLELLRRPARLPGWHMIHRAVTRPWRFRPLAAGLALLAPGRHDIVEQLAALRELETAAWPDQLWITAVRRRDSRRVVFGRPGAPPAPLHLAVAASCAVPGYFAPVSIAGHSYVDGGIHSPTNAAVLRGSGLDLAIIVSPMSGPAGLRPDLYAVTRRHSARLLRREVRALEEAGVRTLVFTPGAAEQEAIGNDMMSRHRLDEVLQQSFFAAGARAAAADAADLLRLATDRRSEGA
ncbi:patatin-like phospholipase family protein [Geodermatophilus sp. URMC 64]